MQPTPAHGPMIRVRDLTVAYRADRDELAAVRDVSLDIAAGAITGIVGESGSGKTTLALALMNAVPGAGRVTAGSVEIEGLADVTELRGGALRRLRGRELSYVLQSSQSSFNPLRRVGKQLLDVARSHGADGREVLRRARSLCERMGLDADRALSAYPHELSGGMRQRVDLVFAMVLESRVLILDEPTTALDTISQAAVLRIVAELHRERGLTTILVSHDLGVVAEVTDRLVVMYAGRVVEEGLTTEVLRSPSHPYTRGLVRAIPRVAGDLSGARPLAGSPPDLGTIPPEGCAFRDRCPLRLPLCDSEVPPLVPVAPARLAACHAGPDFLPTGGGGGAPAPVGGTP